MKKVPVKKAPLKKISPLKKGNDRKRYFNLSGLVIIILLGIIIYSNSFNCSFHFDDSRNIVDNPTIRNLSDVKAWWNFYPTRPVAVFTFALNYHFNQLDVRYWHLVNLIIHLVNACLVYWLTLLIFSSPALKDHKIVKHKNILAFITALLFVSHPLATQSVTYIVQRMTSMVAMFYLFSVSLYLMSRLSDKGNTTKILLYAGSFIAAMLAMLTKENAFTLPFAILLVEFFFIRTKKPSINFKDYRLILIIAASLAVIIIIPLQYSFSIFNPIPPSLGHTYTLTPFNYFLTQFSVIVKYIQLLFLPVNQILDYNFPITTDFFELRTILCFLVLLSLIILAIFLFNRNRIISFGIFWFFLTLLIESSIIPINDVIFEHRTYLPSYGFFLILSSGLYTLFGEKYKFLSIAILSIIIGSNSYLTYARNKVWKDDITLWTDNIAKDPGFARPLANRAYAYEKIQQWDKAIDDCSRAIRIDPKFAEAYYTRGAAFWNLKEWDKAIYDYTKAIEIDSNYTDAYYHRGIAFWNLKEFDKAISDYTRKIEIDPDFPDVYYNRGIAFGNIKEYDKAIADYTKAISLNPDYFNAYNNRGAAFRYFNKLDKAIEDYSRAIEINPQYADAYYNRANAYGALNQWDKAIADYTKAIEVNPDFANAYYNRGIAYGNLRDWEKAITDYSRVIGLDPKYAAAYSQREIAYRNFKIRKSQ